MNQKPICKKICHRPSTSFIPVVSIQSLFGILIFQFDPNSKRMFQIGGLTSLEDHLVFFNLAVSHASGNTRWTCIFQERIITIPLTNPVYENSFHSTENLEASLSMELCKNKRGNAWHIIGIQYALQSLDYSEGKRLDINTQVRPTPFELLVYFLTEERRGSNSWWNKFTAEPRIYLTSIYKAWHQFFTKICHLTVQRFANGNRLISAQRDIWKDNCTDQIWQLLNHVLLFCEVISGSLGVDGNCWFKQ